MLDIVVVVFDQRYPPLPLGPQSTYHSRVVTKIIWAKNSILYINSLNIVLYVGIVGLALRALWLPINKW